MQTSCKPTRTGHRYGTSAAWLLDGMDATSQLDSVDIDGQVMEVAESILGHEERLLLHQCDGAEFLQTCMPQTYDLIFADAWPGKCSHLDDAIAALRIGGIYVVDDLLSQPNWPEGHSRPQKVLSIQGLERDELHARLDQLLAQ
ncbi:MAG: O-methyltransferase [Synechococcus sp.]